MNFVVHFILAVLLVTTCKKRYSKFFYRSLAIIRSLSTGKITKIQPLRKLESCMTDMWVCLSMDSKIVPLGVLFLLPFFLSDAFLLGKSVETATYSWNGIYIHFCFLHKIAVVSKDMRHIIL